MFFVLNSHTGPSQGGSRFASVVSGFTISIMRVNASHYLSHVDNKDLEYGKIFVVTVYVSH